MSKYLVLVQDDTITSKLKTLDCELLYPLKDYCIGFIKTFTLDEVPEDCYVYLNRVLDNKAINNLKNMVNNIKVKGIVMEDLGVLDVVKDLKCEKILFQNHQLTNYESINDYLDFFDSCLISTDITNEEVKEILSKARKPLCLFSLGHVNMMYSRRTLITNYHKYHHLEKENPLEIGIDEQKFISFENEYGTYFYDALPLYNSLDDINIKFKYINTMFISNNDLFAFLERKKVNFPYNEGFMHKKTIFKIKEAK